MNDYIRLTEAPEWCIQYPTCSACTTELDCDYDSWTCPTCGTSWDMDAADGERGTLYAEWSGDEPGGPAVTTREAVAWGLYREQLARHKMWPSIHPNPPARPTVSDRTGCTQ